MDNLLSVKVVFVSYKLAVGSKVSGNVLCVACYNFYFSRECGIGPHDHVNTFVNTQTRAMTNKPRSQAVTQLCF